jgi:Arylsulfotransferase (ASST)
MNENWTRRQLLRHTGTAAAAAAGLGLVACGTSKAGQNYDTGPAKDLQHFVSRPDLTPPKVTLTVAEPSAELQYLFLGLANSGPGQGGTMIMDTRGNLIWFSPDTVDNSKMDFNRFIYNGEPVLTWFQGRVVSGGHGEGVGMIADSSYNTIAIIQAHSGLMVDLHEFQVTAQGTALVSAYRTLDNQDLRKFGGPKNGWMLSGFAQEIDIATGELVFEWNSLDHVGLEESYLKITKGVGTKAKPWDYFHINTIAPYDDEHLLIGARNTWGVYLVRRKDGQIVWRLNGKKSDFTMGPGSEFYWQHDTRPHGTSVLTVFDDGYNGTTKNEKQSRALVLNVDLDERLVTLDRAYTNPTPVLAKAMGNAQLLPGGGMFVGWGTNPYFSEFAPDGKLVLEGKLTKGDPTYRSYIGPWSATPAELPALAVRRRQGGVNVYASWNGATEVASWSVLANKTGGGDPMPEVGSATRTGFETVIPVRTAGPYFAVQPRDKTGRVLSRSLPVKLA